MAANNWSKTTQQLLTGTPGTQISFGEIRAAIGDTSKSISASELHRQTDLDAPYDFSQGKYPSSSAPHLPYVLDATENVGVPTSGAITPQDIRGVIKEYVIEQDTLTEEENFNVTTLSSPTTPSINADWNSNLNKNISKFLKIKGRLVSTNTSNPGAVADQPSSNLTVFVNNAPSSYGVYGAGGGINQPGGHAISISQPSGPAIRKVFVECEGSDARIYGGGGGGKNGTDGTPGTPGTGESTGVDGVDGTPGTPGGNGSDGGAGSDGSDGSDGQPGSTGTPGMLSLIHI